LAFTVSGNCVVVLSGTLDSGVWENTGGDSTDRDTTGGRTVIARLPGAFRDGLIGWTYW
jgi:hypothetical protein